MGLGIFAWHVKKSLVPLLNFCLLDGEDGNLLLSDQLYIMSGALT